MRTTDHERPRVRRTLIAILAVLALLAGACGDDGDDDAGSTTTGSDVTTTDDSGTSSTDDTGSTASTVDDSTTTTDTGTTNGGDGTGGTDTTGSDGLPGEPWDGFAQAGDVLAVMGVAHDDVLNIRDIPGNDGDIVATAEPTADDVVATGEARALSQSLWYEVTYDGVTGWASVQFLGYLGSTDDATAEFLDGGDIPEAETMQQLGELVADGFASTEPASSIVQSVAPTVGDLGEITYDVIGLGDDATAGYRLHVFGTPTEGGEGFSLKSIERTTFCSRGLSGDLCA